MLVNTNIRYSLSNIRVKFIEARPDIRDNNANVKGLSGFNLNKIVGQGTNMKIGKNKC